MSTTTSQNGSVSLRGRQLVVSVVAMLVAVSSVQAAVPVPGPADAGRIEQREALQPPPTELSPPAKQMRVFPNSNAPEESRHVTLKLREVRITGMHVFKREEVEDIYAPYLDRTITLDTVWMIAGELTERYRNAGYFLSRAMVPQQEIVDGAVTIRVVEGYVGEVQFSDEIAKDRLVSGWIERLKSYRPLKAEQIESVLLQLNDLPGVSLHAVLEPITNTTEKNEGAVRLMLERRTESALQGSMTFDNNGSKFLGPYEGLLQLQAEILPMQQTTFTGLAASQFDELKYGGIRHEIPVIQGGTLSLYGSKTAAQPGYTLKTSEIESDSTTLGIGFDYKPIRQRQETLTLHAAVESRDTDSDILGTPLTRDAIRALRTGATYEVVDRWAGYNIFNAMLSEGLDMFGASKAGQLNLSRAEATPDFTKFELSFNRSQGFGSWAVVSGVSGQIASGPLFSSEEFGYGGQAFGRAYDDSEITGDHGIAATAELRYTGLDPIFGVQPVPYAFYDIGMVWNYDQDQDARASGSSGGAGVRIQSDAGISGNIGVAFPLTRTIANPIYGNGKNPRLLLQCTYGF